MTFSGSRGRRLVERRTTEAQAPHVDWFSRSALGAARTTEQWHFGRLAASPSTMYLHHAFRRNASLARVHQIITLSYAPVCTSRTLKVNVTG